MRVDDHIEDAVRSAFAAAVDKDADGIPLALRSLSEDQSTAAVAYAAYVVGYVTRDLLGADLGEDSIRELANDLIKDVSAWFNLGDGDSVAAYLLACANGDTQFSGTDPKDVALYGFVVGGHLLSRYRPEGTRWFEYLDSTWNAAEAAPDST